MEFKSFRRREHKTRGYLAACTGEGHSRIAHDECVWSQNPLCLSLLSRNVRVREAASGVRSQQSFNFSDLGLVWAYFSGSRSPRRRKAAELSRAGSAFSTISELSKPECRGFGPTYAAEHVEKRLGIRVGKDTLRKWMITAGLWRSPRRQAGEIHCWRERRACFGELVQWDTSVHDWLEGRGERIHLLALIDDATRRLFACFVRHDSTEENLRVLWQYLQQNGRPLEFYTDKASLFEVTPKLQDRRDGGQLPLTQLTRALVELGIRRSSAHSPQAKERVERCFATAQDRLVKGLRLAGARTLEQAEEYLLSEFLPAWSERFTVAPAHPADAHRPLRPEHDLAAILSHVEERTISNHYTIQFRGMRYQIARSSVRIGMRGETVRVEARLDGKLQLPLIRGTIFRPNRAVQGQLRYLKNHPASRFAKIIIEAVAAVGCVTSNLTNPRLSRNCFRHRFHSAEKLNAVRWANYAQRSSRSPFKTSALELHQRD